MLKAALAKVPWILLLGFCVIVRNTANANNNAYPLGEQQLQAKVFDWDTFIGPGTLSRSRLWRIARTPESTREIGGRARDKEKFRVLSVARARRLVKGTLPPQQGVPSPMDRHLRKFLVRRYVGSEPLAELRSQIVSFLESLGWSVELHTFQQTVPDVDDIMNGEKGFSNIIATWQPQMCKKRIFACHYESKYVNADSNFIGAMDSAVPCAYLLSSAELISSKSSSSFPSPAYSDHSSDSAAAADCVEGVTTQLVFFDGEEAIKSWTAGDKLYGSTALANLWAEQGKLEEIELFVLLDLLGFKVGWDCTLCSKIISYREATQPEYDLLVSIEAALKSSGQLVPIPEVDPVTNATFSGYLFAPEFNDWLGSFLDDDHAPFQGLGVERILHLIPFPFPKGHHTENDNEDGLDQATTLNTELIIRCFICSLSVDDPSVCCDI